MSRLEINMIGEILGKETADDIMIASIMTGLMTEKQASSLLGSIEKSAQKGDKLSLLGLANGLGSGFLNLVGKGLHAGTQIPAGLGWLAVGGATTGILGASAYDAIKERLAKEDPEAKFNQDVEALYSDKNREIEDARWMARVRSMRDELVKGYKKMSPEEYSAKYNALIEALDEKKEVA